MEINKALLGSIAIVLTFVAFIPYIKSILAGKTKPHVFSWTIWGIATFIVFLAQVADKGGAGSWTTGISGIITLAIAGLAYLKTADNTITKVDWVFFILALSAMPLWYVTSNPLWAVVILTSIDLAGFFPTIRKAYVKPFEEQLLLYILLSIRNVIAIAALEHYSLTTVLFPAAISTASMVLVVIVALRRRKIAAVNSWAPL